MTIILAIIGTIIGAVAGAAVGFFGSILVATALGASNMNGGLAMGAATTFLPLGAVIGAVLALVLVLKWRKGKGPDSKVSKIVGGILLAGCLAIGGYLYKEYWYVPPAPTLSGPVRTLHVEIRLPADMIDEEYFKGQRTRLYAYQTVLDADKPLTRQDNGGIVVLGAQHRMHYRVNDRKITLWVRYNRILVFELPIPEIPVPSDMFSDWQPVSRVGENYYDKGIDGAGDNIFIRTRVSERPRGGG